MFLDLIRDIPLLDDNINKKVIYIGILGFISCISLYKIIFSDKSNINRYYLLFIASVICIMKIYMTKSKVLDKRSNIMEYYDKINKDETNKLDNDEIDEDMYKEVKIVDNNMEDKILETSRNYMEMKNNHKNVYGENHPIEVMLKMQENTKNCDIKKIKEAITDYSGVKNMPQDATEHILEEVNIDRNQMIANGNKYDIPEYTSLSNI